MSLQDSKFKNNLLAIIGDLDEYNKDNLDIMEDKVKDKLNKSADYYYENLKRICDSSLMDVSIKTIQDIVKQLKEG